MIINNPIIVNTTNEYEISVKGPGLEELLKMFPSLRLRDDKYLYFEEDGYSPENAIDYSKCTFKTNKWAIVNTSMPFAASAKDGIFRIDIIPVHPIIGDSFSTDISHVYYNDAHLELSYEEASNIYDNPKAFLDKFIPQHLDLFGTFIDIAIKNIFNFKQSRTALQPTYQYPYSYSAFSYPIPVPKPYENMEFQPKVSPETHNKMKSAFTDFIDKLPTTGTYEPLSNIFGSNDESENS